MAYLNQRGYVIIKKLNLPEPLEKIRKDLTVRPIVNTTYKFGAIPRFEVFLENDNKIYTPKFFGIKAHGYNEFEKIDDRIPNGDKIFLRFTGKLRDNQLAPVQACMDSFHDLTKRGGILQLPPGYGKTICAINLICQLGVKTLIVVNRDFLMNQWIQRIKQVCPTARVGIIQQKKFDIENKDIVLGMLQTLSYREFDLKAFKSFGFTVWDECHNVSTESFSRSMFKLGTKYRLGLSATPERPDGLSKVFKWHLGEIIYAQEQERKGIQPIARVYKYTSKTPESDAQLEDQLLKEVCNRSGDANIPLMLSNIGKEPVRNLLIINILVELVKEGRFVLVLSERVAHLKLLQEFYEQTEESNLAPSALYIGATSQKDRDLSDAAHVIFGSVKLVSEAYDNPKLDTLIYANFNGGPIEKRPETSKLMNQTTGRIFRKVHTERPGLVIDIQDTFSVFTSQGYRRLRYYRNNKYETEIYEVKEQKNPKKGDIGYTVKKKSKTQAEIEAKRPSNKQAGKLTGFLILEDSDSDRDEF